MVTVDEERHRLARLILNAWTLGESLDALLIEEEGNLDPDNEHYEYERKEFEENKAVVEMYRERANIVLDELEDLVALAL